MYKVKLSGGNHSTNFWNSTFWKRLRSVCQYLIDNWLVTNCNFTHLLCSARKVKKKIVQFFFLHWNCINIQISYYWKVFLFQRGRITRQYSFIENCLYIFSVWLTNNFHSKPLFIRIWSFKYINLLVIILSTLSLLRITRFSHQIFSQKSFIIHAWHGSKYASASS